MGIKTRSLFCSFAFTTLAATAGADVFELEIGEFRFQGSNHPFQYVGEYGEYVGSSLAGDNPTTVGEIQVGKLAKDLDIGTIAWIRITGPDTQTSQVNPGADIDLFAVEGLPDDVQSHYHYDGPNTRYQGMVSDMLAQELSTLDFIPGQLDEDLSFVSVGTGGSLLMMFEAVGGGSDGGGSDGGGDDDGGSDDSSDDGHDGPEDSGDDDSDDGSDGGPGDVEGDGPLPTRPILDPSLWSADGREWADGFETQASFVGLGHDPLLLMINEIAPIPENVTVHIGFMNMMTPVPGPAGGLMLAAAAAIRRRRRR